MWPITNKILKKAHSFTMWYQRSLELTYFLITVGRILILVLFFLSFTAAPAAHAEPAAWSQPVERGPAGGKAKPTFIKPLADLFVHKNHLEGFRQSGINCVDCHTFAVKTTTSDPTSLGVDSGFLRVDKSVCHQCHLGYVNIPRSNQCNLCHSDVQSLAPDTHKKNWRYRHGMQALQDTDSCRACHAQKACSECHSQRNPSRPVVHRANFRMTHSIEARANPQSCASCHSSLNTCVQCHTKGVFP